MSDMEQRSNDAAAMVAQTLLSREECASDMEQRSNDAASMDAQILSRMEECASGMEQRLNDVVSMVVRTNLSREASVEGMGHFALLKTNPLHLIYHVDQHSMKRPQLFPISK